MFRACGAVTWDEKQGETGMEAVHRQARGRDLPAHFTWTSVRPDSYRVTVRERKRDSETDTYRQARPQDRKAGKESEGVTGHANDYPRESIGKLFVAWLHHNEKIFIYKYSSS